MALGYAALTAHPVNAGPNPSAASSGGKGEWQVPGGAHASSILVPSQSSATSIGDPQKLRE